MVARFLIYPLEGDKKRLLDDLKTIPSCHPQIVLNEVPVLVSLFCQNELQQEFVIKQIARLDSVLWILPFTGVAPQSQDELTA